MARCTLRPQETMQVTHSRAWCYAILANSLQRACCIVGMYGGCSLVWTVTMLQARCVG